MKNLKMVLAVFVIQKPHKTFFMDMLLLLKINVLLKVSYIIPTPLKFSHYLNGFYDFRFTGREIPSLNLGSYNYLGFAESHSKCADDSIETIQKYGWATCSSRHEIGNFAS